jgi:hypothetical protein
MYFGRKYAINLADLPAVDTAQAGRTLELVSKSPDKEFELIRQAAEGIHLPSKSCMIIT